MSPKRLFSLILLIYLILALAYSILLPLGEAPDEADHYAYQRYIGLNRSLPQGPTVTQSKHPPLYHAAAAALSAWTGLDFDFLRSNPDALPLGPDKPPNLFIHTTLEDFPWRGGALAMHLARLLSVLLGAVTLWGTWRVGQVVFFDRPEIGLLAAAFLAGLPGFLFISASVNNDNAAGALGTLVLLMSVLTLGRGLRVGRTGLLGLFMGLGLLAKVGVLAVWPLALVAIAGAWWLDERRPRRWQPLVGHLTLAGGLALLVAGPWLLRNLALYGDPLAWELVRATVDERLASLSLGDIGWLLWGLHRTFWGRFGGAGQIQLPTWGYALAAGGTLAVIAGALRYAVLSLAPQGPRAGAAPDGLQPAPPAAPFPVRYALQLLLLVLGPLLVFASLVRYSAIALGTDQARLMWPALAALAVWVGVGIVGGVDWLAGRRGTPQGAGLAGSGTTPGQAGQRSEAGGRALPGTRAGLVVGFAGLMAMFGLVSLLALIRPAFAPPQPVAPAGSQAAEVLARFGALELVGAHWPEGPLPAGQPLPVRLSWRAGAAIEDDLRPTLRLVHRDGWLAAEWSHSPAGGRYATDHWLPGEVIADDYLIAPDPPGPGVYLLEVGVRPFGGDWLTPQAAGSPAPFFPLGQIEYR